MSVLKDLIKYFYEFPLNYFPVMNKDKELIGYISKKAVLKDINDLEMLKTELKEFLKNNITKELSSKDNSELLNMKMSRFPIVFEDGDIKIINGRDFDKLRKSENMLSYKKILKDAGMGVLVFDFNSKILFKNDYFNLIKDQSINFDIKNFITEIIINIDNEDQTYEGNINADFDGVEITYSVKAYIDTDKNSDNIVVTTLLPKTNSVIRNNINTLVDENVDEEEESETFNEKIKRLLKEEIIQTMNDKNFSLNKYLFDKEKILLETISEILDNNLNLMSKVLKIDGEEVKFKIKRFKVY